MRARFGASGPDLRRGRRYRPHLNVRQTEALAKQVNSTNVKRGGKHRVMMRLFGLKVIWRAISGLRSKSLMMAKVGICVWITAVWISLKI